MYLRIIVFLMFLPVFELSGYIEEGSFNPTSYSDDEVLIFVSYDSCLLEEARRIMKSIPNPEIIKAIDLSYCGAEEVPEEVFHFTNLEYLNLSQNEIKEIPEEICNLVELKVLSLGSNKLKQLPESIGHLMNLEELALGANQLSTLPSSIVNLINATINFSFTPLSKTSGFSYLYPTKSPHTQKVINHYNTKVKLYINDFQGLPEAYTVSATSGLSVRNKPKLNAKKIGAMPHKLKIAVYEESSKTETIDGITAPWMRVKAVANGKYMEGWAWGGYLEKFVYTE